MTQLGHDVEVIKTTECERYDIRLERHWLAGVPHEVRVAYTKDGLRIGDVSLAVTLCDEYGVSPEWNPLDNQGKMIDLQHGYTQDEIDLLSTDDEGNPVDVSEIVEAVTRKDDATVGWGKDGCYYGWRCGKIARFDPNDSSKEIARTVGRLYAAGFSWQSIR